METAILEEVEKFFADGRRALGQQACGVEKAEAFCPKTAEKLVTELASEAAARKICLSADSAAVGRAAAQLVLAELAWQSLKAAEEKAVQTPGKLSQVTAHRLVDLWAETLTGQGLVQDISRYSKAAKGGLASDGKLAVQALSKRSKQTLTEILKELGCLSGFKQCAPALDWVCRS